jgi:uncharacterized tellurite resistance protein B-like protein
MLRTLKDLFDSLLAPPLQGPGGGSAAHRLHLATAVLLVEVMRADSECSESLCQRREQQLLSEGCDDLRAVQLERAHEHLEALVSGGVHHVVGRERAIFE